VPSDEGKEPEGKWVEALYPRIAGIVQTHRHLVDAVPGQQQIEQLTKHLPTP
jgi:hypothetical protein